MKPLLAMGLFAGSVAFANTPILVNTNFDGFEGWIAGSNRFLGGVWQEYVLAPDAYPFADRVSVTGDGFTFKSWDDEVSDTLENYLLQEFGAGPVGSPTETEFATGDVIVFKGKASATRTGANTSDMVVRAFIKVLGYNELGWAFQIKPDYSAFHDIGSSLEDFELRVTFPDLAVDDSLQILQLGFEITNSFDGTAMDAGTIYFENIEGYVEGGETPTWAGYPILDDGWVNTGEWLGWINVTHAPWVTIVNLDKYAYLPEESVGTSGAWMYLLGE